jgi:hypothetical protein
MLIGIHRNEALDLPSVVRAESPNLEENSDSGIYGDSRGYYSEGTYIAAPPIGPVFPAESYYDSEDDDLTQVHGMSPQDAYTTRLLSVFRQQRNMLRSTPVRRNIRGHTFNFTKCIIGHDPVPAELVAMTTKSVYSLLKQVTKCLKRGQNVSTRMSSWIISILARLDEKEMDSDSIYLVRELSRKAIWVRFGFDERFAEQADTLGYASESQEEDEDEQIRGRPLTKDHRIPRRNTSSLSQYRDPEPAPEMETSSLKTAAEGRLGTEAALEAARQRLLSKLASEDQDDPINEAKEEEQKTLPDSNTKATLDMIIAVVGEIYGQRDLLEARIDWLDLD